jgi:hypothetical protein
MRRTMMEKIAMRIMNNAPGEGWERDRGRP